MQIHELKRKTARKTKKVIGRGGKRGTTSGRGTKGQKARAGRKTRPQMRDIIKKLPKLRGYRFSAREDLTLPINLFVLDKNFNAGDVVSPEILAKKGLVSKKSGKLPRVKILGSGKLSKNLIVKGCAFSQSVKEKIEVVGGQIK